MIRRNSNNRGRYVQNVLIAFLLISTAFMSMFAVAEPSDASLKYTFEFTEPNLKDMKLSDTSFTSLSIPGCISIGKGIGMPNLPVRFAQILIPFGMDVKEITVSGNPTIINDEAKGVDLTASPIIPYQKPVTIGEPLSGDIDKDDSVYSTDSFFPDQLVKKQGVSSSRGYTILHIGINPLQYNPVDAELRYYDELQLTIQLEESSSVNELFRGIESDREWVKSLVMNPEVLGTYDSFAGFSSLEYDGGLCDPSDNGGLGYDYVIITTEQNGLDYWDTNSTTPYNWESLMDKHETEDGLSCTLVTIEEIDAEPDYENSDPLFDDTPAHIREFCRDAYEDWGTSYILVGGDQEILPRRLMDYDYESNVETDIYWSNLDKTFNDDGDSDWGEEGDSGFDLSSELFIGSLPCDEPQDVSNWMTKSFYYADSTEKVEISDGILMFVEKHSSNMLLSKEQLIGLDQILMNTANIPTGLVSSMVLKHGIL